jgi:hypothetical protein
MTGRMARPATEAEEILRIEMFIRILENDALGRYIRDHDNLERIMSILGDAYEELRKVTDVRELSEHREGSEFSARREVKAMSVVQGKECPYGYKHVECACLPLYK